MNRRAEGEFDCPFTVLRADLPHYTRLFAQTLLVLDEASLQRLRATLDNNPVLALAARSFDLSNRGGQFRVSKVGIPRLQLNNAELIECLCQLHEVYRRAAGVLRLTRNVTDITLLHVALSDTVSAEQLPSRATKLTS